MDNTLKNRPSFPSNYVTILDLKERWLKQQQQQQEQEAEIETTNEKSHIAVDGEQSVKTMPRFRNYKKPKPSGRGFGRNPNRNDRGPMKQYRVVKVSNSTQLAQETRGIQDGVEIGAQMDDRVEVKNAKKKKMKKKKKKTIEVNDQTEEIAAKMKEVVVAEEGVLVTADQDNVVQEKQKRETVSKKTKEEVKVLEKRVLDTRNRNVWSGRRGNWNWNWNWSERRRLNRDEGNRNKGLMWVKKGETSGKLNNCCAVEGGNFD